MSHFWCENDAHGQRSRTALLPFAGRPSGATLSLCGAYGWTESGKKLPYHFVCFPFLSPNKSVTIETHQGNDASVSMQLPDLRWSSWTKTGNDNRIIALWGPPSYSVWFFYLFNFFGISTEAKVVVLLLLLHYFQMSCMSSCALTSNYGWFTHQWPTSQQDKSLFWSLIWPRMFARSGDWIRDRCYFREMFYCQ